MSYYQFNRQEFLQKPENKYSKGKAAGYYLKNKEPVNKISKNWCKNLPEEDKNKIKEYQRKRYQE